MQNLSLPKRIYYAYLGRAFAFAYRSQWRRFLGYAISSWLKFIAITFFLSALVLRWGQPLITLALLLVVWIYFSYWRAAKLGYSRFVADETAVPTANNTGALDPGQRASLYASGIFAVVDREQSVLLRPAEYWLSPNGEHGVMVNEHTTKYLYQFFQANTLQTVQPGWMIFGKKPLRTLAISFLPTWGPANSDDVVTYMVGGGVNETNKGKIRTIYFTFEDTAVESQVWQTLKNISAE